MFLKAGAHNPMHYKSRIHSLQKMLHGENIEAVLVTDFYNILYLTGFKTLSPHHMEAKLLVTSDECILITDARYQMEARQYFADTVVSVTIQEPGENFYQALCKALEQSNIDTLGFESSHISYAVYTKLKKQVSGIEVKPTEELVLGKRMRKDPDEIRRMKKAAALTDHCLKDIVPLLKKGVTEHEIVYKVEDWIREHEVEFSFEPIVAFDEHTALPHYNNKISNAALKENSLILIDIGISYKNYCSDITRVFFTGAPTPEQQKAYGHLLEIQQKTIEKARQDIGISEIDTFARNSLTELGYPSIPHSTGHGIGLEVHEGFTVGPTSDMTLQNEMVFTIEPGIYFEGKWGMRIEDTVCCRNNGIRLTQFSKKMTIL